MIYAEDFSYGEFSNSEPISCVEQETVLVRKVLSRDQNNGDYS